jgi:hypothetical protein
MGRQVEAQLEDLALAGCAVRIDLEVNRDEEPEVFRYAFVTFPDGSGISSYLGESLVFDCRNRDSTNYWALEQIIDLGVPFRWS